MPAAEAQNAEGARDDTRLTLQATISDRQTGLSLLGIGEVGIGDSADTLFEQNIILRESSVSTVRRRT